MIRHIKFELIRIRVKFDEQAFRILAEMGQRSRKLLLNIIKNGRRGGGGGGNGAITKK